MPTYEYECQKCGHHFDVFQRISEAPKRQCPQCKGRVKRLIGTGAGLLFKGSGFYATDYRSDGYRKSQKADSAPPPAEKPATTQNSPAPVAEKKSTGKTKNKS